MNRKPMIVVSLMLILIGGLTFVTSVFGAAFGFRMWRLWPLFVIGAGLCFVLPPLLVRGKPGLGAFFIPGVPLLVTGGILMFASVSTVWQAWEWLWPQEVLGVALGFLFAALYMRCGGLLFPAIIIGANGLLLQFCALTGWWSIWSVLWVIEPLSVAAALLAFNIKHRSRGVMIAAIIIAGFALVGAVLSVTAISFFSFMPLWRAWRWIGPLLVVFSGVALLIWALSRPAQTRIAAS